MFCEAETGRPRQGRTSWCNNHRLRELRILRPLQLDEMIHHKYFGYLLSFGISVEHEEQMEGRGRVLVQIFLNNICREEVREDGQELMDIHDASSWQPGINPT